MNETRQRRALVVLLSAGMLWGCASTKASKQGMNPNVITREEIMGANANNLHDVVQRLRPQWLRTPAPTGALSGMNNVILVFQDQMNLGGPDALRQLGPELAYELRWMDGVRATAALPGISNGQHVEGVIIVSTKPPSGGN
jgi:hypothetical protein